MPTQERDRLFVVTTPTRFPRVLMQRFGCGGYSLLAKDFILHVARYIEQLALANRHPPALALEILCSEFSPIREGQDNRGSVLRFLARHSAPIRKGADASEQFRNKLSKRHLSFCFSSCYCLLGASGGCGRRPISVGTAMERAPFLPTARTAKKWLSVETLFKTVSPGAAANS